MNYAFWADVTAVAHISILILVVIGLVVAYRYKRFRPWEAGIVITIVVMWSYFGNCPLAILEQWLRDQAGQHVDIDALGFTSYYASKLFGFELPSRIVQRYTFFTAGVLFSGSIKSFSPVMHMHLFSLRHGARKLLGQKFKRKRG